MVKIKMDETFIYEPNLIFLRSTRDQLLTQTDKYLLPDFPITPEQVEIVKEYRQALRDFTKNNYEMPEKPSFIVTLN
jgi:hypothetical protein